jgi:hypothetical protein
VWAAVAVHPGAVWCHSIAGPPRQFESELASRPSSTLDSPVHCQLNQSTWLSLALSVHPTRISSNTAGDLLVSTRGQCQHFRGGFEVQVGGFLMKVVESKHVHVTVQVMNFRFDVGR